MEKRSEQIQLADLPDQSAELPVINISLKDAQAYARWAGKEIPTGQEWEKSCRGEMGGIYPWGDGWGEGQVEVIDGQIRKKYEERFATLNKIEDAVGRVIFGKEQLFTIPDHPLTQFDEEKFLNLLKGLFFFNLKEKQGIAASISELDQEQIDKYLHNLAKDRAGDVVFEKEYENYVLNLKREHYDEVH
ncbi:MAG: hypothetical protein D3903_03025 [Candidatus Electrothrix sp. GM3_4]|nr:hypothetical protein [Candidatus Electrothrix sp. GM3_4]